MATSFKPLAAKPASAGVVAGAAPSQPVNTAEATGTPSTEIKPDASGVALFEGDVQFAVDKSLAAAAMIGTEGAQAIDKAEKLWKRLDVGFWWIVAGIWIAIAWANRRSRATKIVATVVLILLLFKFCAPVREQAYGLVEDMASKDDLADLKAQLAAQKTEREQLEARVQKLEAEEEAAFAAAKKPGPKRRR